MATKLEKLADKIIAFQARGKESVSEIVEEIEQAKSNAKFYLVKHASGIDVEIVGEPTTSGDGYYDFVVRHNSTGVEAVLSIHGLAPWQVQEYIAKFGPHWGKARVRATWNQSSMDKPKIEDFIMPNTNIRGCVKDINTYCPYCEHLNDSIDLSGNVVCSKCSASYIARFAQQGNRIEQASKG